MRSSAEKYLLKIPGNASAQCVLRAASNGTRKLGANKPPFGESIQH